MLHKIIALILLESFFFLAGFEKTSNHLGNLLGKELWATFCSWGGLLAESLQGSLARSQQENESFVPTTPMNWDLPTLTWVWKWIFPSEASMWPQSHPTSWIGISWDPAASQPTSETEFLSKYYGPPCMPNSFRIYYQLGM